MHPNQFKFKPFIHYLTFIYPLVCSFWLNFNFTWIAVKCVGPVRTPTADCHLAQPCNTSPLLALVSWAPQQRHCPVLNGFLSCSSMPRRKPFHMQSWRLKWVFPAWLGNILNLGDHLLALAHIVKWVFPAWLGNILNLGDHLLALAHIYIFFPEILLF